MTRVLIVDDSALIRQLLQQALANEPDLEVVGTAPDPYVARDLIVATHPDVITLDLEMPRMDGVTFLRKLMHYYPLPVVVVSSLTPAGSEIALEALRAGAVDVICKPGGPHGLGDVVRQIAARIRLAAKMHVNVQALEPEQPRAAHAPLHSTNKIVAVGASTGGTVAIEAIVRALPPTTPGVIVTQHMPEAITKMFAARLDGLSQLSVREARDGDSVMPGVVLVAPGDHHLVLRRDGARFVVALRRGPRVNGFRPSVDVMFRSVARAVGANAIGVLLTGMGRDGAAGLLEMREAGAHTLAQDEHSSVVFGMPKAAIDLGAVEVVAPLSQIPQQLLGMCADDKRP
jgi:two-component system, chemotaxis family, protein-glutamate methylesterase/glutaminase